MKIVLAIVSIGFVVTSAELPAAELLIIAPEQAFVGETFSVEIWGDFSGEGLIAGGITFLYDAALVQLNGITLNLAVIADFSCPGSPNCPAPSAGSAPIVWGEFLSDLIGPLDPAPVLMATLDFTAISAAAETQAMFSMIDNPATTGGWFGAGFSPIDIPSFVGASTNVEIFVDSDGDLVADSQDNCVFVPNGPQRDTDADGIGNRCDPDIFQPNNCVVNFGDLGALSVAFFSDSVSPDWNPDADLDGDGTVNFADLSIMEEFFFSPPGPSGLSNLCE